MKLLWVTVRHFWPTMLVLLGFGVAFAVAAPGGIGGSEWAMIVVIGSMVGATVEMFQCFWLEDHAEWDEFGAALPHRIWTRERDGMIEVCRRGGGYTFESRMFNPDAYEAAMDFKNELRGSSRSAAERRAEARKLAAVLNR